MDSQLEKPIDPDVLEVISDFRFSEAYYHQMISVRKLENRLRDEREPTTRFILVPTLEEEKAKLEGLVIVLEQNLKKMFALCRKVGIDQILIENCELVTLEKRYGGWPAAWAVAGGCTSKGGVFSHSCGNCNQAQTSHINGFIPEEYIGFAWDVNTREKVDLKPFERFRVMTRKQEPRRPWG